MCLPGSISLREADIYKSRNGKLVSESFCKEKWPCKKMLSERANGRLKNTFDHSFFLTGSKLVTAACLCVIFEMRSNQELKELQF